jgi:hypothetical protein
MSSVHDFQNDIQVRTDERADGFVFRSELLLVWDVLRGDFEPEKKVLENLGKSCSE